MPISDPMTWVPAEHRWVKRIRGVGSFYFAPRKHGIEPTKEASRPAMRAWWAAQEAIIDSKADEDTKKLARYYLYGLVTKLPPSSDPEVQDEQIARSLARIALEETFPLEAFETPIKNLFGPTKREELESLAQTVTAKIVHSAEPSRLIKHQIDRWLQTQESKVKNGTLKHGSFRQYRQAILLLREWQGDTSVDEINNDWLQDRYNELSNADMAPTSKNNRWTIWGGFLDYLDTIGLITMPKLFKKLSFSRDAEAKKPVWTVKEYQGALAEAKGVKRLALLLAANCSFYAADMAECYQHYDKKAGTIKMARVKTDARDVVFYLWPETIKAMNQHGHELADLYDQASGRNRTRNWARSSEKLPKPIKNLRHTSQTFLHNSEYHQYKNYMCGLKEKGISEQWYSHEWQDRIQAGFKYLRKCYGFR